MNNFGIYATITLTHNLVILWYLIYLERNNGSYYRITDDNIILISSFLLQNNNFWWTHHAVVLPIHLIILDHKSPPIWIALKFILACTNLCSPFFLKPNSYENWLRNFLAPGIFILTNMTTSFRLLLIIPSWVEKMYASRMSL